MKLDYVSDLTEVEEFKKILEVVHEKAEEPDLSMSMQEMQLNLTQQHWHTEQRGAEVSASMGREAIDASKEQQSAATEKSNAKPANTGL